MKKKSDYLDYLDLDHTCIQLYKDDLGGEEQTLLPLALSITVGSRIPIHYQRKCQWMTCQCRFSYHT